MGVGAGGEGRGRGSREAVAARGGARPPLVLFAPRERDRARRGPSWRPAHLIVVHNAEARAALGAALEREAASIREAVTAAAAAAGAEGAVAAAKAEVARPPLRARLAAGKRGKRALAALLQMLKTDPFFDGLHGEAESGGGEADSTLGEAPLPSGWAEHYNLVRVS